MTNHLDQVVAAQKRGDAMGIYSVCSADATVIRASCRQAVADGSPLLVEATSNQVDQYGGYTGMLPPQFREFVLGIAREEGLPEDRLVLGGDHLGPNRWQSQPAEEAMAEAERLVAAYVEAGFTKIHLDCSFVCAGDQSPISDEVAAARAAQLLAVTERVAAEHGTAGDLRYVIGTEVPVPGGHQEDLHDLMPTTADAARATIAAHREAFAAHGLDGAWERVMALVVQPAVEFDSVRVVDYDPSKTGELKEVLTDQPTMVFEAHSTDYQRPRGLRHLVEDHWAVLKVGPGLTFALREGLYALSRIEDELVPEDQRSRLREVVEARMVDAPGYWQKYYPGTPEEQRLARTYSYSDRLRYYWPDPEITLARERLMANLRAMELPLPLVSQFLPVQYERVREGAVDADPESLLVDRVRDALRPYAFAAGVGPDPTR